MILSVVSHTPSVQIFCFHWQYLIQVTSIGVRAGRKRRLRRVSDRRGQRVRTLLSRGALDMPRQARARFPVRRHAAERVHAVRRRRTVLRQAGERERRQGGDCPGALRRPGGTAHTPRTGGDRPGLDVATVLGRIAGCNSVWHYAVAAIARH